MEKKEDGVLKDDNLHDAMTDMKTLIDANGETKLYKTMDEERRDDSGTLERV
jgi:hypothetical protein